MNSFKNLLNRVSILTEAKTSPFAGTHPSFGGITKTMSTRGMSSAPYDTVKFLATFLYELNIISDDERKMILKSQGFKGKQLDRKSTRLNSSHRCISYAVFCLKKKKTTQQNKQQTKY